jgi:hypothetical protein
MGELEDGSGFLAAVLALGRGCWGAMFSGFAVAEVSSWIWFGDYSLVGDLEGFGRLVSLVGWFAPGSESGRLGFHP